MATGTYAHAQDELQRARWSSALNVVAGAWLMLAPFVLSFEGENAGQWNHIIVGAAVALMALVRASDPDHRVGVSWANAVLGVWMIVAPYVLGYSDVNQATTNSIVMGVVILGLAAFSAYETNQAHKDEQAASRGDMT